MSLREIIQEYYQEAAVVIASAFSAVFGKRMVSKNQMNRIEKIEGELLELKNQLRINTLYDKESRLRMKEVEEKIDKKLDKIDAQLMEVTRYIFDLTRRK